MLEVHLPQEVCGLKHSRMIYPFDGETLGAPGTGTHENGVVAAGEQLVDIQVGPDSDIGMDVHAEVFYLLYLATHHLLGKPVLRYAEHQHAARFLLHFVYVDGKTSRERSPAMVSPAGPEPITAT